MPLHPRVMQHSPSSGPRSRPTIAVGDRPAAEHLRAAAVLALAAMPVAMVVAHRSSLLVVTVAAVLAAAAAGQDGEGRALLRRLAALLGSPVGIAAVAALGWALLAVTWSSRPGPSLGAYGEFGLALVSGLVLAATLPGRMAPAAPLWFAAGLLVAAALVVVDLSTGLAIRRAAGLRAQGFVLNRPALTLLVLLPATVWLLGRDGRRGLATLVAAAVVVAILRSESGAARLGLLAAGAASGLALVSRRAAVVLVGAGLLAAVAVAPVLGEVADRLLPAPVYRALAGAHARDRVDIWTAFGAAVREAPFLGHGFGSSARLGDAPVAARVDPAHRTLLAVGHPHNAPLQLWVELGAVGAALAATILVLVLGRVGAMGTGEAAVALAILAGGGADMMVGQGAWQGWWPAAIGAALVLLAHGRAEREV